MKTFSVALVLLFALVLLGCSDNPGPVASTSGQAAAPAFPAGLAKGGAKIHTVTASCQIHTWDAPGDPRIYPGRQTLIVDASQYEDLSFSGRVFVHSQADQVKICGDVLKFSLDGNRVKVEAVITSAPAPYNGCHFFMALVDNGEGLGQTESDQTTVGWFVPAEYPGMVAYFSDMAPQPFIDFLVAYMTMQGPNGAPAVAPIDGGQIQIR